MAHALPSIVDVYRVLCCRPQYFKLVDKCVTQIVLHKSGLDPDFHYTKKILLDVDSIIGEWSDCCAVIYGTYM